MKVLKNQYIKQAANKCAVTTSNEDVEITNVGISQGGLLNYQGGGKVTLKKVWSDGAPKGGGVYFIITSTNPTARLEWDNTGISKWITNGAEAGFRLMQCRSSLVIGVKFKCRKWEDDDGTVDWWKEIVQCRSDGPDGDNGKGTFEFRKCSFVGPVSLGRQKDPSGAQQNIGKIIFRDCDFTDWPRITSGVKKIEYHNCTIAGHKVTK